MALSRLHKAHNGFSRYAVSLVSTGSVFPLITFGDSYFQDAMGGPYLVHQCITVGTANPLILFHIKYHLLIIMILNYYLEQCGLSLAIYLTLDYSKSLTIVI